MNYDLGISIVISNPDPKRLADTLNSVSHCTLNYKLYIINNGGSFALPQCDPARTVLITNRANVGFARGHNVAMRKSISECKYHLVLNPDVSFSSSTLEQIFSFMETNSDVGIAIPLVSDFKGQPQHLAKRLPSPLDLIIRRVNLTFVSALFGKRLRKYEMADKDHTSVFDAPFVSGCFMFIRTTALEQVGLFDERFFLYMEDVDLSRRIFAHYRNILYPHATIFHYHERGSYKRINLFKVHVISAIKYFNKWGWIFDGERRRFNLGGRIKG